MRELDQTSPRQNPFYWWLWLRQIDEERRADIAVFLGLLAACSTIPFHRELPRLIPWIWDELGKQQVLGLLTALLAAATYGLFKRTSDLASGTEQMASATMTSVLQQDEQHQEALSGIMLLNGPKLVMSLPASADGTSAFTVTGELVNVGGGPAFQVSVSLALPKIGALPNILFGGKKAGEIVQLVGPNEPGVHCTIPNLEKKILFDQMSVGAVVRVDWSNLFGAHAWTEYTLREGDAAADIQFYIPDYVPKRGVVKLTSSAKDSTR